MQFQSASSEEEADQQAMASSSSPLTLSWSCYLIVSARLRKTYVGVTNNFPRRLKQHNGECKGGAKASRAGRPWACACVVHGFKGRSEACAFESKWKSFSRALLRKRKASNMSEQVKDERSPPLLHHRKAALCRVQASLDCSHLEINWQLDSLSSNDFKDPRQI